MIRGSREKKIAEKGWPPDSGTRKADGCLRREETAKCLLELIWASKVIYSTLERFQILPLMEWLTTGTWDRALDSLQPGNSLTGLLLGGTPDWKCQKQLRTETEWVSFLNCDPLPPPPTPKVSPPHSLRYCKQGHMLPSLTPTPVRSQQYVRFLSEEIHHPREVTAGTDS